MELKSSSGETSESNFSYAKGPAQDLIFPKQLLLFDEEKKPHKLVIIGVSLNHTRTKKLRNISINTAFVMQWLSPKMNCKHLKIATKKKPLGQYYL